MVKASPTGGVKPMSITGRFVRERERALGMTDEDRAFRRQWLKDQELSPNEPRVVPELYKERYNILRRTYRYPLDRIAQAIQPAVGHEAATVFRMISGKFLMLVAGAFVGAYYFKYHGNDWTKAHGWRVLHARPTVVEGDPGYPKLSEKSRGRDYASQGFEEFKYKNI